MFKNYLKIAWRNLIKNKVYSVINVLGLAAGMAVAMLIAFWIWDEVTYDRSFTNHKQLAQIMTTFISDDGTSGTVPNVACLLATNCVVNMAAILKMWRWHRGIGAMYLQ